MKKEILFITFIFLNISAFCGGRPQHDAWTEQALFGGSLRTTTERSGNKLVTVQKPDKVNYLNIFGKQKLQVVENIVALCVDDFNRGQEGPYNELVDFWSKNGISFPSFSEIDYSDSPKNHEKPTHKGWNKWYMGKYGTQKKGNMGRRKQLFIDTIGCVFKTTNNPDLTNAICQYLTTLHVIGDIIEDSQQSSNARLDIPGVINELEECLPIILDNRQGKTITNLEKIRAEVLTLIGTKEAFDIPEELYENQYKRLAGSSHRTEKNNSSVLNILYSNVPDLLQGQQWFFDAFYKDVDLYDQLLKTAS